MPSKAKTAVQWKCKQRRVRQQVNVSLCLLMSQNWAILSGNIQSMGTQRPWLLGCLALAIVGAMLMLLVNISHDYCTASSAFCVVRWNSVLLAE